MNLELHKKKISSQILFSIFFGIFVNLAAVIGLAYVLFIKEYGGSGPEKLFNEFLLKPDVFFSVLFLGETKNVNAYEILHMIFSDLKIQGFFWLFYFCLMYLGLSNKKSLEKRDASEYGSHGSQRWATDQEIKSALLKNKNGFIVGEFKKKLAVHSLDSNLNNNICAFGGSGSGKSAGFSIPNILYNAMEVGESMVITDPKGELYNTTVPTLRQNGYDILVFNLLNPKKSMRYNSLDFVDNIEDAMSLAEMIIANSGGMSKDPMWTNAEIAYFAALMMYLKETRPKEEQHVKSILQFGTRIGSDEELLDEIFFSLPEDSEALEMYHIFRNAKDKTRAGILIGFGVRLKLWVSRNIAELTSKSDFDINQLGQKKTALFILTPDSDTTYDLLPALLIDQMFNQLYKQAGRNDSLKLNVSVRCILDELANIARINGFERKVSTMRSRGISVVPIFQSITQFKNRYNDDKWSEILSSTDTIAFLGTNDKETAKYFSEKLGNTTLLINSMSEGYNRTSMSHNFMGRPLMTPDEIERMREDQIIIFQRGKNPMLIKKHMYYKQKKWAKLQKTNWNDDIKDREHSDLVVFKPFTIPGVEGLAVRNEEPEFLANPEIKVVDGNTGEILSEEVTPLSEGNSDNVDESINNLDIDIVDYDDNYIDSLIAEEPKKENLIL